MDTSMSRRRHSAVVSRRHLLQLLGGASAGAALSPLLTACGGEETSGGQGAGGGLTVTDWAADNEFYAKWVKKINSTYEGGHEGWSVKFTNIPSADYSTVMKTNMSAGEGPDVYPFLSEELESTIANDWLMPLDDYLAESALTKRIPEWVLDLSTVDGKTYALARAATPHMLGSNMALLDAAGIDDVPETMPDFIDAATAVKEQTGEWGYVPFLDPADALFVYRTLAQWAIGFGSDFGQPGKITIDVPEIQDAMTALKGLIDTEVAPFGIAYTDARALFEESKAAFVIDGSWVAGEILTKKPDLYPDIWESQVPFPTHDSLTGGGWVGINASTENADAAWEWIEGYFSKDAVKSWIEGSLRPAGTTDKPDEKWVKANAPWWPNLDDVVNNHTVQLGYAPPGFQADAAEFRTEMVPFFIDIVTGKSPVKDSLAEAQQHMTDWAKSRGLLN